MPVYKNLKAVRKLTNSSLTSIIDITNLNFTSLSSANLEFLTNIKYDETLNTFQVYSGTFDFVNITDKLSLTLDGIPTFTIDSLGRAEGQQLLVKVAETKRQRFTDFNDWPEVGVPGEIIYTGIQNQRPEFGEDFIGYLHGRGWVSLTDPNLAAFLTLSELDGSPPVPECPAANTGIIWIGPPGYETATVATTQTLYYTDENCNIYNLIDDSKNSGQFRFSQFADTIIPKTAFVESNVGKYIENSEPFSFLNTPFIDTLENGNQVTVVYNNSVLKSGVMIFESYEILSVYSKGYIEGWWVAYKQDPTDATKLIKCGEVQMTQQFWDYWYDWTAKDSGDNVVKFVTTNYPSNELTPLETFTTTLTYTGTGLTAVDSYFNYGGATARSLYESLTGLTPTLMNNKVYNTVYILDDDYYGMAMGAEAGWFYYRNTSPDVDSDKWYIVGFNILTGLTKAFNIVPALSTLTNWSTALLPIDTSAVQLINHPNGIFVTLDDGRICNNGDNNDGVTAIWSPYWSGANTEVIYLGLRNQDSGGRELVNGNIPQAAWYWDNVALYLINRNENINGDGGFICYKYNTNIKQTTLYQVPFLPKLNANYSINSVYPNLWANNDGMFLSMDGELKYGGSPMSVQLFTYFKHEDSVLYSFHLDCRYPTHAFGDKIYNISNFATRNMNTLGVPISTYKNMEF